MSINFTVDETNPAYVRLACQGTYTQDALLSVVDGAIEIAASKNRKAVLVDIRDVKGTPPDMFGRYQLGVGTAKIQREKSVLVTITVVGNEPMIDPRRLGETVFLNRGGHWESFHQCRRSRRLARTESRIGPRAGKSLKRSGD